MTILGVVVLSGLVFLAWSQPWGSLMVTGDAATTRVLEVPVSTAAPALAALGLAGLALAAALAIAGPVIRIVLGVLQVVVGLSIVLSGTGPIVDPVAAGAPVVTSATGVAGIESIRAIASSQQVTAWAVVTIVLGVLLAATGVMIAATTRRWPASGRRYQAVRFTDESGATVGAEQLLDLAADDTPDTESPDEAAVRRKAASVDNWDSLSQGKDPTA
jgi:hypothetical protein